METICVLFARGIHVTISLAHSATVTKSLKYSWSIVLSLDSRASSLSSGILGAGATGVGAGAGAKGTGAGFPGSANVTDCIGGGMLRCWDELRSCDRCWEPVRDPPPLLS